MSVSEKLAATVFGAVLMLSALSADGQQPSTVAEQTREQTSAAPASTQPRAPADLPPNPPKVKCRGETLTISAQNSTLAAVLNAVRVCTGAQIDIPESARADRLFAEVGPGPVRAVLADFLSSTDFNYAIQASLSDPQKIQTILLSPRSNDSVTEVANDTNLSVSRRAWHEARQNYVQSFSPPQDEATQEAEVAPSVPVESAVAPASTQPVEGESGSSPSTASVAVPPAASEEIASPPSESSAAEGQGKSTQQMIGDMRRMFDQRKRMVQQPVRTVQ